MRGSWALPLVVLVILLLFLPFLVSGVNTAAQIYADNEADLARLPSKIHTSVTSTAANAITLGDPILKYQGAIMLFVIAAAAFGFIIWATVWRTGPVL